MPRAMYQVCVIPFKDTESNTLFAVFQRSDEGYWQFIAGGGEDKETPEQAARREALEEGGILLTASYIKLDTTASIATSHISLEAKKDWPKELCIIPCYYYAAKMEELEIKLSGEHTEYRWVRYKEAVALLKWDSDKTALWELNERLKRGNLNPKIIR